MFFLDAAAWAPFFRCGSRLTGNYYIAGARALHICIKQLRSFQLFPTKNQVLPALIFHGLFSLYRRIHGYGITENCLYWPPAEFDSIEVRFACKSHSTLSNHCQQHPP